MTQTAAFLRILEILKNHPFEIENTNQLTESTLLSTFLDSIEIIELAIQVEKELESSITDYTVENWNTIGDIANTYQNIKNDK